ncbi:MAG: hypothetical protein E6J32_12950 [Chloroflexi bacterium]|nr:MAG: hypothetical protein E6J32_12950 [Chloroflexota bacterium]
MTPGPDEITPLYRAIKLVGALAIVIFVAGALEFLSYEPPGQATGTVARIQGVYAYDPDTQAVIGAPAEHFARGQPFAAVVDWASIPAGTEVAARWFDSFGEVVGQSGPGPVEQMSQAAVPVALPKGLKQNIPGTYLFVVERISRGQPVEVLARRLVEVERT